jgi:3-phosphoshikimate 1-carboxyvinyltransferase
LSNSAKISLHKSPILNPSTIQVTGSKSESNRALILKALSGDIASIKNLSEARDTRTMQSLLLSTEKVLDVLDAGTTMRFLTAYLTATNQHKILTGTARMKERPISILIDALKEIGGEITYQENRGYPPIEIMGLDSQVRKHIKVRGDVSSQYISALLMIAPVLEHGLIISLEGSVGSRPYIEMTLGLMEQLGISHSWNDNTISIETQSFKPAVIHIEPDWSGTSYWYSFVALAKEAILQIPGLRSSSFQGDSVIREMSEKLGVLSEFNEEGIVLAKTEHETQVAFDFTHCPDLAQTIAVICAAKKIRGHFTGLKSLRIKETDRVKALQIELSKINAQLIQPNEQKDEYELIPSTGLPDTALFDTYEDHRMAMAFAPLSTVMDIEILDPDVVDKSYPSFWNEVKKAGIRISD